MYTKTFNQINRNDVMEAGGEGAFWGEGSIEAISNSYTLNEKEKSYSIQVAVVIQVMINPEI